MNSNKKLKRSVAIYRRMVVDKRKTDRECVDYLRACLAEFGIDAFRDEYARQWK